jgi:hypothetical protein
MTVSPPGPPRPKRDLRLEARASTIPIVFASFSLHQPRSSSLQVCDKIGLARSSFARHLSIMRHPSQKARAKAIAIRSNERAVRMLLVMMGAITLLSALLLLSRP